MKAVLLTGLLVSALIALRASPAWREALWKLIKFAAPPAIAGLLIAWLILNLSQFTTGRIF